LEVKLKNRNALAKTEHQTDNTKLSSINSHWQRNRVARRTYNELALIYIKGLL